MHGRIDLSPASMGRRVRQEARGDRYPLRGAPVRVTRPRRQLLVTVVGAMVLVMAMAAWAWQVRREAAGTSPQHTNRLIHETSPYLLQHAHNPVDWYPWGPEALEKAKKEGKPIFLSVGYSACHWCGVMERE